MTSSGSSPSGPTLSLSPEHEMIRQTARDFAQKEIAPIAAEFDESGEFPDATVRKMGEMGFMGIEIPEEYGGAGLDTLAYVLALEEICKVDAAHGTIMSVNNSLYGFAILRFGTEEQKQHLPGAGGLRQSHRRLLAHRADVRLGRRHDAQPRRAPGRGLPAQRAQVVGHQRPGGRLHHRLHHDRPGEEAPRHHGLPGRHPGRPGFSVGKQGTQAGHPRLGHQRDRLRGLPLPARRPPGRGGRGLQDRHDRAGRRAHRHRLPGAGDRRGLPTRPACSTPASARPSVRRSASSRARASSWPT